MYACRADQEPVLLPRRNDARSFHYSEAQSLNCYNYRLHAAGGTAAAVPADKFLVLLLPCLLPLSLNIVLYIIARRQSIRIRCYFREKDKKRR